MCRCTSKEQQGCLNINSSRETRCWQQHAARAMHSAEAEAAVLHSAQRMHLE